METYVIVCIACGGFIVLTALMLCLGKTKETVANGPARKPNNQRSRAVTSSDGFMIYPAAASLPTVSDSGNQGHHHGHYGGYHHGGHHGGGGCGGGGYHGGGGGGCGGGGGGGCGGGGGGYHGGGGGGCGGGGGGGGN